jgi:hypothetical protein
MAVCAGLSATACGGEDTPAPGTPAAGQPAAEQPTAAPGGEPAAETQQVQEESPTPQETQLLREVFSYQGAGRDPFASLLLSADVRPLFEDLRVTAINFDPRYPGGSVAVLRDTTLNQRYTVRIGDELGRMRVVDISPDEVMLMMEEFGVERQMSLTLRRRQEGTQ